MIIRPVVETDLQWLMELRWKYRDYFRTSFKVNDLMQKEWFKNVVSNRESRYRFYMIEGGEVKQKVVNGYSNYNISLGYATLELQWENGFCELGIVLEEHDPKTLQHAFDAMATEVFGMLRMETIYIECYRHNPALADWKAITKEYKPTMFTFPRRKYFDGEFRDSQCFVITKEAWLKANDPIGSGVVQ